MDKATIEIYVNIATILGFLLTIIGIIIAIIQLHRNTKSISQLADSIKQQQNVKADNIENFHMSNIIKEVKNGK